MVRHYKAISLIIGVPLAMTMGAKGTPGAVFGGIKAMGAMIVDTSAIPWGWVAVVFTIAVGALVVIYRQHVKRAVSNVGAFLVTA